MESLLLFDFEEFNEIENRVYMIANLWNGNFLSL